MIAKLWAVRKTHPAGAIGTNPATNLCMRRLILFDIDGTLLAAGGAGARALRGTLAEIFGTPGQTEGFSFAGKTDPQILHELLGAEGILEPHISERLPALWRSYLVRLEDELPRAEVRVLQGVHRLLDRIEAAPDEAVLGLLTGNLREGARLKLNAAGIDFERFTVGAFGCDNADRAALPEVAVQRAEERTGKRFEGKDVVIIGDTPNDIACGASLGVRTIAVATGSYTETDLRSHGPDYIFPDLSDTEAIWDALVCDHPPVLAKA